jgi:uncharacterized repeat protein (TIGR04138 family)
MLCEKCGQRDATQSFMFGLHYINLCDACHARLLEGFERMRKVAEQYGTVTRIPSREEIIQQIVSEDSQFNSEAYKFVAEAMADAFCIGFPDETAEELKIPTTQLITAIRKLASKRFGTRARGIFKSWGVTKWSDFGTITGRMQKAGEGFFSALDFRKRDFQRHGDFDDVFPKTDRD